MLGEADLNPFGFHATPAGRRMPSMMSPTVVLRDGELELGLGSGGSNRIRSAITQTIVRCLDDGLDVEDAVAAPRLHFEAGEVHAEPGISPEALDRLAARGYEVVRWPDPNLFFGGVHAVARTGGELRGGGDPAAAAPWRGRENLPRLSHAPAQMGRSRTRSASTRLAVAAVAGGHRGDCACGHRHAGTIDDYREHQQCPRSAGGAPAGELPGHARQL